MTVAVPVMMMVVMIIMVVVVAVRGAFNEGEIGYGAEANWGFGFLGI